MKLPSVLLILLPSMLFSQELAVIKSELEAIYLESLKLRGQVIPTIRSFGEDSDEMKVLNTQILDFDSISLVRVKEVIDSLGWLGKGEVGEMANEALFLTIQHSLDPEDRVHYFPFLKSSAEKGQSNLTDMATMYDRIQVEKGEPQRYGTQSRLVNGVKVLYPIEDAEHVNRRRKKVGLKKLREF